MQRHLPPCGGYLGAGRRTRDGARLVGTVPLRPRRKPSQPGRVPLASRGEAPEHLRVLLSHRVRWVGAQRNTEPHSPSLRENYEIQVPGKDLPLYTAGKFANDSSAVSRTPAYGASTMSFQIPCVVYLKSGIPKTER